MIPATARTTLAATKATVLPAAFRALIISVPACRKFPLRIFTGISSIRDAVTRTPCLVSAKAATATS
ncbi:MAG: hypothetical protein S4CHLAM37_10720 [Chlamydiia bacterium]|nr:hypothetical protein [Chlamydiia bacterium]